jgi:hypothetical protein
MTARWNHFMGMAAVLVLGAGLSDAWAQARVKPDGGQQPAAPSGGTVARIRDMTGVGPRAIVKTPEYSTSISRGKATPKDWAELTVTFDTEPEWIDELTLQYYVLVHDRKKDSYGLFKGSVTHLDVAKGRGHLSVMYLRPVALLRYGEVVAMAVELVHKGEVIDSKNDDRMAGRAKLAREWWKSQTLPVKEGYILNRLQTPFGLINYDDYESVR